MQSSGFVRYCFLPRLVIFLGTAFLLTPENTQAAFTDIILSEIQVTGENSDDEFVELFNTSGGAVDIAGLQLRRNTSGGTTSSLKVFGKDSIIHAHGYYLWAASESIFAPPFADTKTGGALASNNSLALFSQSSSGVLIDSVTWGSGARFSPDAPTLANPTKNKSLVRDTDTLSWSLSDSPTPTNSHDEVYVPEEVPPDTPPDTPPPTGLRLNEILPHPGDGESEFIELYNESSDDIALSGFILKDASKTGSYTFPADTTIESKSYFVVTRATFDFALNDSEETVTLLDGEKREIDSAHYEKTKKGVSLNYTSGKWQGGEPTPGAANKLNSLPETRQKVPKEGYKKVPVNFEASGKDKDDDQLKYTWNFGDGHRSFKDKTTHTYEKNGKYTVTLTTSDGSDDTTETFSLRIRSYPHLNVRIVALFPNPKGNDTKNEWLIIVNKEKKWVNLKGYSIATGSKKLVNHPIKKDFILAPKQEARLTQAYAKFTLPNQKAKIELRAPDGKTLQKLQYKLEKAAADNSIYIKEKDKPWTWKLAAAKVILPSTAPPPPIEESFPPPEPEEELPPLPDPEIEIHKKLSALLYYGTHIEKPEAIVFIPSTAPLVVQHSEKHYAVTFMERLIVTMNASLNGLLNNNFEQK